MRNSGSFLMLALVLMMAWKAEGQAIRVVAEREGKMTRFHMEVCIAWTPAMLRDFIASGEDEIEVSLGDSVEVTELDPVDDDELGQFGGVSRAGVFSVEPNIPTSFSNPLNVRTYTRFGEPIGPVGSCNYGDENPGDFQLGTMGGQEGDVPPGSALIVPGSPLMKIGFPVHRS